MAVAMVIAARDDLNAAAQGPTRTASLAALARPSRENCRFCDYRICCQPFQDALGQADLDDAFVSGRVIDVRDSAAGRALTIDRTRGRGDESSTARLIGLPAHVAAGQGDLITVANANADQNGLDLRLTWESSVVIWVDQTTVRGAYPGANAPPVDDTRLSADVLTDDAFDLPL